MAIGFGTGSSILGGIIKGLVTSYALNVVTNKIFGPKAPTQQSPTYTFMRTQANSNLPVPIIYGKKVRVYGNKIWQTEGSVINAIVCFGQGKIKSFSNVRINNIPIEELPGCSYTAYLGDGVQEIDSRVPGETQRDKALVVGGLKYDAYLALTITGSDKVSGDFTVSADVDGRIVRIYSDVNTYTEDSSENPIWNILDYYTNRNACAVGLDRLLLQTFINEAAYCDGLVNGKPRFTLNLALDERKSRGDWLTDMMATCRCHPLYQNGRYGVFIEKPTAYSQIFNVKKTEEFKIFFAKNKDIVDKVNVRFIDPTNEWTKVPASAEVPKDKRKIKRKKPLPKNIDIWGVTNFDQASRLAWFYANESATSTMYAYYRTNRKASNRTATDVIVTNDPVFQLQGKKWWVIETGFDENGYVTLLLREYNEDLYGDQLGSAQPVVNVTTLTNPYATPPDVTNLAVDQVYYRLKDSTIISYITGSCIIPGYRYLNDIVADISEDNGAWKETAKVNRDGTFIIPNVKTGVTYKVRVRIKNYAGLYSEGTISETILITGKDDPPSNVESITATIDQSDSTKVRLSWTAVSDIDLAGYEIKEGSTVIEPCWAGTSYTYTATSSRQHNFSIRAVDNSGNHSAAPATKSISVTIEPAQVAGFSYATQETDRSRLLLSWTANSDKDLSYYEIRDGQVWEAAAVIATQLKATSYQHILAAEGNKTYLIKAFNVAGKESVVAASVALQVILRPDAPIVQQAQQEPKDRSLLKLSWIASPGKDIAGYEIRKGTVWNTGEYVNFTKDTAYWYSLAASGTYNFMVRAKTVAGELSNVANVSATVSVQPPDVTGFTAQQMIADRTKVRLLWDQPYALDIAYFEIRKGTTWDTASVIGQRVTGTFYDVIVIEETTQTFWIKAVSIAGNYSQYPSQATGIYSLKPTAPTGFAVMQDPDDRSQLKVLWNAIGDSDLLEYELRTGFTWETSTLVAKTKETSIIYSPSQSGDIKFLIKSKNTGLFYSDEVFATFNATLEPSDVVGFMAQQNGEYVLLTWEKVTDPDVVGYEIREGSTYDNGTLIQTGVTVTVYQFRVDTEITRRFHCKAINRAGKYSRNAVSSSVTITNLPPKNVIQTYDEIMLKTGTHSGTEFGLSSFTFASLGGKFSDYVSTKFSDIGGATVLKLKATNGVYPANGTYTLTRKDMGQVITANISAVFQPSILFTAGTSATLQFRTSRDNITWTEWTNFQPIQATFRYADFRVLLATADTTKTPEVNALTIRVDVPDFAYRKTVVVTVGGSTFDYGGHVYYSLPVVTPTAVGIGNRCYFANKTANTVFLQVFNNSNVDVGGTVDLSVIGY